MGTLVLRTEACSRNGHLDDSTLLEIGEQAAWVVVFIVMCLRLYLYSLSV